MSTQGSPKSRAVLAHPLGEVDLAPAVERTIALLRIAARADAGAARKLSLFHAEVGRLLVQTLANPTVDGVMRRDIAMDVSLVDGRLRIDGVDFEDDPNPDPDTDTDASRPAAASDAHIDRILVDAVSRLRLLSAGLRDARDPDDGDPVVAPRQSTPMALMTRLVFRALATAFRGRGDVGGIMDDDDLRITPDTRRRDGAIGRIPAMLHAVALAVHRDRALRDDRRPHGRSVTIPAPVATPGPWAASPDHAAPLSAARWVRRTAERTAHDDPWSDACGDRRTASGR